MHEWKCVIVSTSLHLVQARRSTRKNIFWYIQLESIREDTHKVVAPSFSGWTTKGVGRANPPDH